MAFLKCLEFPEFGLAEMHAVNFVILGCPIKIDHKMNSTFGRAQARHFVSLLNLSTLETFLRGHSSKRIFRLVYLKFGHIFDVFICFIL